MKRNQESHNSMTGTRLHWKIWKTLWNPRGFILDSRMKRKASDTDQIGRCHFVCDKEDLCENINDILLTLFFFSVNLSVDFRMCFYL